jgi:hypothetical protein
VLGQKLSPFTAAALGLVLNTSAYCAEIFRSGIVSIARGRANYSAAGHEAHAACIHEPWDRARKSDVARLARREPPLEPV